MLENLKTKIITAHAKHIIRHSTYHKELNDVPDSLFTHWQNTAHLEFPGIPRDAVFFACAAEGLLMFFDCVQHSDGACALPSKAADSVWHAWSSLSQAKLDTFCRLHYGRTIPHIEAAQMDTSMDFALARTLVLARRQDRLNQASITTPALFTLDRRLKMPGGYAYKVAQGKIGFTNMDHSGAPDGATHFPIGFAATELLGAGLISQYSFDALALKKKSNADGAACGSSYTGTSCDAVGSGDAGGCNCGSSCGSSCGGGCGGG